jgi:hypothetical protein
VILDWLLSQYFQFSYLFYLFLLILPLLVGQMLHWPGVALHKIAAAVEGGVLVAKAQHPWKAVVGL